MNQTTFPCFRKLRNDKSFYKISSERTFTEIQCVGNQHFKIEIITSKYPEIILIQDMLNKREIYDISTEEEFNTIEDKLADK
jgi:predicted nucleic acid-binding protein